MKLKYKYHSYSVISNYEIELPDDTVFVHVENDIGQLRYDGFGHYLGASKILIENNSLGLYTCDKFPDVFLYEFYNVVFEDNINIISSEEFTTKFELDKCYVFSYTKDKLINNFKYNNILEDNYERIPGKLVSISKILKIRSQNLVDAMTVTINSWISFDDCEVKMITLNKDIRINSLINDNFCKIEIKKDCDKEFTEVINQVLSVVNKKVI